LVVTSLVGPAADLFFAGVEPSNSGDQREARAAAEELVEFEGRGDVDSILEAGRRDAEALVQRYAEAIKQLAAALLEARWHELDGLEAMSILERNGVRRGKTSEPMPNYPPDVSSHGRGPQQDAASFGYERRDGLTRPSANPDSLRAAYPYERRTDGGFK
jgi:hypothetical protein